MQTLDYQTPQPKRPLLRFLPVGFCILGFLFLLNMILIPSRSGPRDVSNRVKSQSNLRQIGQAILMYSNENAGAYPPNFAMLLLTEDITSEVFSSPASNDTKAGGPTTRAIADNLESGGHCTYVYLGRGWNAKAVSADAVVAYEPPTAVIPGCNALFGDGHVEYCGPMWSKKLLATLTTRPPASTQPVVLTPDK